MLQRTPWAFLQMNESETLLNVPYNVDVILQKKKKVHLHVPSFLKNQQSFALRTVKAQPLNAFCISLST